VLEKVSDPLRILLVGLFALDGFNELGGVTTTWQLFSRMLCTGNQYLPVDSMHTSLQLFSQSQAAMSRNPPV
jgi:hypothetical protein